VSLNELGIIASLNVTCIVVSGETWRAFCAGETLATWAAILVCNRNNKQAVNDRNFNALKSPRQYDLSVDCRLASGEHRPGFAMISEDRKISETIGKLPLHLSSGVLCFILFSGYLRVIFLDIAVFLSIIEYEFNSGIPR